ncbi:hypothetical protein BHE74_00016551 [Ensete ventricosum]|nr:hypothetical protein BHE74_00016551 [Ensete ventricosum]
MECGSCLHGVVLLGCLVCLLILALGTLFTSADTLLSEESWSTCPFQGRYQHLYLTSRHCRLRERLRNNRFNGTLDLGDQISSQLSLVDLQHNNIQKINTGNYSQELMLDPAIIFA